MYNPNIAFSSLVGKTLVSIERTKSDDALTFITNDGKKYMMYHEQDCCEGVDIEDICGNLDDLLNAPILLAYESTDSDIPKDNNYQPDSFTWTFYNISTIKGSVTIRWYGESNGYYSERVSFVEVTK